MREAGLGLGLKVWTVVAAVQRELIFLCFLLLVDTLSAGLWREHSEGVLNIKPAFKMIRRTTSNLRYELQMSLRVRFTTNLYKCMLLTKTHFVFHTEYCYFILSNSVHPHVWGWRDSMGFF